MNEELFLFVMAIKCCVDVFEMIQKYEYQVYKVQ
jgi:hypothetical protein